MKSPILLITPVAILSILMMTSCRKKHIPAIAPSYAQVTTLAGPLVGGSATGPDSAFRTPNGVAVDMAGNVYVADYGNNLIRIISPAGVVTNLAGGDTSGSANGTDTSAYFNGPSGVAVDTAGNVYVADRFNNLIRKISPLGVVATLAGIDSIAGSANGMDTLATFNGPTGVAVDKAGNVYVADAGNNMIRKISPSGMVTTVAGSGITGSTDATGSSASFYFPAAVAVDSIGNLYVADEGNSLIRKISSSGVVTTIAGNLSFGLLNSIGTAASFNRPEGIAVDAFGNVYVGDSFNNMVREISPSGAVTTLAGGGEVGSTNGTGYVASFYFPTGVAVDALGKVYVADYGNNLIRKISP